MFFFLDSKISSKKSNLVVTRLHTKFKIEPPVFSEEADKQKEKKRPIDLLALCFCMMPEAGTPIRATTRLGFPWTAMTSSTEETLVENPDEAMETAASGYETNWIFFVAPETFTSESVA